MPRTTSGWAIAAGITVATTAACLGTYALMIAGVVEDARLHPNVGSLAPLAIIGGLIVFGWTPMATWAVLSWQVLVSTERAIGRSGGKPATMRA